MLIARKTQYFARIINMDFVFKEAKMQTMFLTITITIQLPVSPISDGEKVPKPVFTKEQPPVCRCKVFYGNGAA